LAMAAGMPRAHKRAKAGRSYPPVASMTQSVAPCWWQKASRAPSPVLGTWRCGPSRPMRASSQALDTSMPQMTGLTGLTGLGAGGGRVLCFTGDGCHRNLPCPCDGQSSDCPVVRDTAAAGPRAHPPLQPGGMRAPAAARRGGAIHPHTAPFRPQNSAAFQIQGKQPARCRAVQGRGWNRRGRRAWPPSPRPSRGGLPDLHIGL
jgi:hypothetical protein